MTDQQFNALAAKVHDLIQLCEQLDKENRALKSEAASWKEEREALVNKSDVARTKVESMITRLKAMEQQA